MVTRSGEEKGIIDRSSPFQSIQRAQSSAINAYVFYHPKHNIPQAMYVRTCNSNTITCRVLIGQRAFITLNLTCIPNLWKQPHASLHRSGWKSSSTAKHIPLYEYTHTHTCHSRRDEEERGRANILELCVPVYVCYCARATNKYSRCRRRHVDILRVVHSIYCYAKD